MSKKKIKIAVIVTASILLVLAAVIGIWLYSIHTVEEYPFAKLKRDQIKSVYIDGIYYPTGEYLEFEMYDPYYLTEEEIDRLYEKMIKVRITMEGPLTPEEIRVGAGCKYVGNGDMYIDLKLYGTIKVNGGAQSISINDRVFTGEIEDITPFSDYVYDIVVKMKEEYKKTAN